MAIRDQLTNERLKGLFKNNFELVNYAIRLGRYYLKSGHEITIDNLLEEVRKNPQEGYLEDLKRLDAEEEETP